MVFCKFSRVENRAADRVTKVQMMQTSELFQLTVTSESAKVVRYSIRR